MRYKLQHVHYMPKDLKPGILYISREFDAAAHLCPCGCGSKIRTPLGPTEWSIEETNDGPTLKPSVGNWQQVCRSHYWIIRGTVIWAEEWTPEQIALGRALEESRRRTYYDTCIPQHFGVANRIWRWAKRLLLRF